MIAKLIAFVFTALLSLTIVWVAIAFVIGLFLMLTTKVVYGSRKPKGWLWVICLFPFLLLSEKGRNKITKTIKG